MEQKELSSPGMRCSRGAGWDQDWDGAGAGQGPEEMEEKTEAMEDRTAGCRSREGRGQPLGKGMKPEVGRWGPEPHRAFRHPGASSSTELISSIKGRVGSQDKKTSE